MKRATSLMEQTRVEDVIMTIKDKKRIWRGHIMRKTNDRGTRLTDLRLKT